MNPFQITEITPDETTCYLVGPEGLVWIEPAWGEPYILAARTSVEQRGAACHVAWLLEQGLVPYGLPLNQRITSAVFGGGPLRGCALVPWAEAPAPAAEDDGPLPSRVVVVATGNAASAPATLFTA